VHTARVDGTIAEYGRAMRFERRDDGFSIPPPTAPSKGPSTPTKD
jgi:hypothetical protein